MRRRSLLIASLLIVMLLATAATALTVSRLSSAHAAPGDRNDGGLVTNQKVGVPSYIYPGSAWTQMDDGAPTVGLAVINPGSGPGASRDQAYADQVTTTQAKGLSVIGYVSTSYAGTKNTARTLAAAEKDVDTYYEQYPNVSGIFVDEVPTDCGSRDSYYKPLYDYIKGKGGMVVLNPGVNVDECYMSVGDVIINFENSYSEYINWAPASWVANYPANRFWHIIHSTSRTDISKAIALSKERNAGRIYVTDDSGDNLYDRLPSYWDDELSLVSQ